MKYTTILHEVRVALQLTPYEYMVMDSIERGFTQKTYLADFFWITRQGVQKIFTRLYNADLITKDNIVTEKWRKATEFTSTANWVVTSPPTEFAQSCQRSLHSNTTSNTNNNTNELFEEFWNLYPKKLDKNWNSKKFYKIKNQQEAIDWLKKWICFWKKEETKMQFIPYPSTFLNQERWLTPPHTPQNASTPLPQEELQISRTKAQQVADFRQITVEEYIADRQRETGKKVVLI